MKKILSLVLFFFLQSSVLSASVEKCTLQDIETKTDMSMDARDMKYPITAL